MKKKDDDKYEEFFNALNPADRFEAEVLAGAYHEQLVKEGTRHLRLAVMEACVNQGIHPDHACLMLDRIKETERNARMKCKNT